MKKLLLLLFLVAGTSIAQTGYVRYDALLSALPEAATAKEEIIKLQTSLTGDLQKADQNVKQKLADLNYKAQAPGMTQEQLEALQKQAEALQNELARQSKMADLQLAGKRNELMTPLTEKLAASIKKIADAKGMKLIIDVSQVAYSVDGLDISLDVAKDLGIPLEEEEKK